MPHCQHCDAFVSRDFVRVFAGDDERIYACPNCAANAGVIEAHEARRTSAASA